MPSPASAPAQAFTRRPNSSVDIGRYPSLDFWRNRSGLEILWSPSAKTSARVVGSEAIFPFTTKGLPDARVGSTMNVDEANSRVRAPGGARRMLVGGCQQG